MINIKKIIISTICIAILSFVIGATDNKNSNSIVLNISYKNNNFLLTGYFE